MLRSGCKKTHNVKDILIVMAWTSLLIQMLMFLKCVQAIDPDPAELDKVLKDFIRVRGMQMDEYTYWWAPITFSECAEKCMNDKTIYCRSFSMSIEGKACSTYEHDRQSAPPEFYNRPGVLSVVAGAPYQDFEWDYYERKSEKYKEMENQVKFLKNLTKINVEDASAVLNGISGFIKPGFESDGGKGSRSNSTALPSELEIAGESLKLVMKLNPFANASLEDARGLTDVVVNVSSALADSSNIPAWKTAQRDPSSPGSSTIVSSAEQLSHHMSIKLRESKSSTPVLSEAEGIAVWLNFPSLTPPTDDVESSFAKSNKQNNQSLNSDNNTRVDKNLDDRFLSSDKATYVFPNSGVQVPTHKNGPSGKEATQDDSVDGERTAESKYFQDVIVLPRTAFENNSVVTNVRYKNLKESMPTRFTEDSKFKSNSKLKSNNVLNSAVLTTSVYPRPPNQVFQSEPVTILFKHERPPKPDTAKNETSDQTSTKETPDKISQHSGREENVFCVYWHEGKDSDDGGLWSKEGCSLVDFNSTHTVCNCTHLTSFAVLLQIVDYSTEDESSEVHVKVLGTISKVGCILSLLGVTIMCAAFLKLKMRTDNMKIHFNLGLAVGFADLTFLFEELAEKSKSGCVLVTILLYYFNMAVLAWMFVEGFHLYSQVVVVFVSFRRRVKYYVFAGWGIPAFIVAFSMGILGSRLGTHETCWLSPVDGSIWAFAAPALFVIVTNMIILVAVVRVIIGIKPGKSNNHLKVSKLRNAVKGSIFLFPLLGTTWLFGLLSLSKETLLFQYVFAITNSLQGFFLFVFHCMCNSEVREDARRHKWFRSSDSSATSSSPPFLSNAFSLNVASGIRRFRNSISFDAPTSTTGGLEENSESEATNSKKIHSLFSKMFALKLPKTIAEKDDKYEAESEEASIPDPLQHQEKVSNSEVEVEKIVPLPGMPTKNETFQNLHLFKTTLSKEAQNQLDQLLVEQIIQNALKEILMCSDNGENKKDDLIEKKSLRDFACDEDDEKKMQMSYDSGLNSIENESLLDEDDDEWMPTKSVKLEMQEDNDKNDQT